MLVNSTKAPSTLIRTRKGVWIAEQRATKTSQSQSEWMNANNATREKFLPINQTHETKAAKRKKSIIAWRLSKCVKRTEKHEIFEP